MPNIRIKDIPTTASATSSTDFIGIDGSANGTRKLNAYSPTFGGNLTVSGTGTSSFSGSLSVAGQASTINNSTLVMDFNTSGDYGRLLAKNSGGAYTTAIQVVNPLTLQSNLTVSGTGTSSFGGKIQSSVATATGYNQLYDTTGITTGRGAFAITSTGAGLALGIEASVGGTSFTGSTAYASYFGTTTATPIHFVTNSAISATLTSGGNYLIGTTVDSSALLQVGTNTTTAAGGMKFGTDTSLFRSAAGQLRGPSSFIDATFASSGLFFGASMTLQANDNVLIKTNGSVTALTLDSSQNATFAGTILTATNAAKNAIVARYNSSNSLFGVTVNSAGQGVISENNDASTGSDKYSKTGLPAFRLGNTGGSGTVPFWIDVAASGTAGNAITWTNAFQIDSSQNATFAGGIIGMTQGNVDNISDDGVASFTPLYNRGFIVINNPDYSQNALIAYFKAGSSYLLYSITKSADVTLNNSTTLTGTTGTDGKLNIGYNNSIIYIENRLGGIGNFQRYALGGTN